MHFYKKHFATTQLFLKLPSIGSKAGFLALLLICSSCQKDQPQDTTPSQIYPNTNIATQRTEINTNAILEMAQWMIDHHTPLIADPAVRAELAAGNYTAPIVSAKLANLGFASYNSFALQYEQVSAYTRQAINDGILTQNIISDILQANFNQLKFNALPEGDPDELKVPCYKEFVDDLALGMVAVIGAASGGPWAAAGAAAIAVSGAYIKFKHCLEQYG